MTAAAVMSEWEGRAVDDWRVRWRLPQLVVLSEARSTNDVARRLAEEGAPAGLLVMAEYQSAGRGRMGRQWTAAPGHSLLLSFLLRPSRGTGDAAPGTAPVRVGLAIAAAVRAATGIDALLKWPNDVVAAGAGKLAGILCEAVSSGGDTVIIAGIGVNMFQQPHDWPPELHGLATSIAETLAARGDAAVPDRAAVMDAVTATMRPLFTLPLQPLTTAELCAYADLDSLRGREVAATGAAHAAGIAAGIATDGALRLDTADGLKRITSATVRLIPHPPSSARSQR